MQRVTRLAPLSEILAYLDDAVVPVSPVDLEPRAAAGCVIAADVTAPAEWPPHPVATRDGWAVASEHVLDASPLAPLPLVPSARWTEVGEPVDLPTDTILRAEDVTQTRTGPEATAPATAGDGVAGAGGGDAKRSVVGGAGDTMPAGYTVRASDAAVLASCGISSVAVRRPTVALISTTVPTFSTADTVSPVVARVVERAGCTVEVSRTASLEEALRDERVDAVISIGGTGAGRRDASADTLARVGKLVWHGLGIAPGESAALGAMQGRPVLLLPGRLDSALAALLIVGTVILGRLAGQRATRTVGQEKLTRKVTSTIGIADLVLLRRISEGVEPLATGRLTLQALAQADGWNIVPPQSEGFPAGSLVEIRPLP